MTITPMHGAGAAAQPQPPARYRPASPNGRAETAVWSQDQVTISPEARGAFQAAVGAEAPVLHLSPAELRALVSPDSAKSPVRNATESALAQGVTGVDANDAHGSR